MVLPAPAALAALLDGDLDGPIPEGPLRSARIDSRRVDPGDIFFALPGARRDGHAYVGAAQAAGAGLVVVRRPWSGRRAAAQAGAVLAVDDPLEALQTLAAWYRRTHIGRVVLRRLLDVRSLGAAAVTPRIVFGLPQPMAGH